MNPANDDFKVQVRDWGREVLTLESQALIVAAQRIGSGFVAAVTTIFQSRGLSLIHI